MKKLVVLFVAALLLTGTSAFAATLAPNSSKATAGAVLDASGAQGITGFMRFSKGVYGSAALDNTAFAIATGHTSGTKYYGTGYDSTAIFVQNTTNAAGTVATTLPALTASDSATAFSGWSKL